MATTVILIRHADKDIPQVEADPPLNEKGKTRARQLIHILTAAGIRAIYTSEAQRAKMTAQPFWQAHPILVPPLPIVRLSAATDLRDHILTHHEGGTVLIVGHADTVPALIRELGGPSLPVIDDCVFDNFFVLVRHSATEVFLTKLKYGEITGPCQS